MEKIDAICEILATERGEEYRQFIMGDPDFSENMRGFERRIRMLDLIGLKANAAGNWKKSWQPIPGAMLSIASVAGFTPGPYGITHLEQLFQEKYGKDPFPWFAYDLMALWDVSCLQRRCWFAFVGSKSQIESDPDLKKYVQDEDEIAKGTFHNLQLGLSPSIFRQIYKDAVSQLKLHLPASAYHAAGNPPLKVSRGIRQRTVYRNTGDRDADINELTENPEPAENTKALSVSDFRPPLGFNKDLPRVDDSPIERFQKLALYGGGLRSTNMKFTPLDQVIAGHAFERDGAKRLTDEIMKDEQPSALMTLQCPQGQGQGLSIALAEVLVKLHSTDGVLPYWIIGDPSATVNSLNRLTIEAIAEFLSQFEGVRHRIHVVIIIDDISEVDGKAVSNLKRLVRHSGDSARNNEQVKFTFVCGSHGDFPTIGTDKPLDLELTDADEIACYYKMADGEPLILQNGVAGFSAIISQFPDYRAYANDTQGFIDLLLEHGKRTKLADDNWFARIDDLNADQTPIMLNAATSELLALPLHENVALRQANEKTAHQFIDLEEVAEFCPNTTVINNGWRGLSLSSSRRSESVLRRLNSYNTEALQSIFDELFATGLRCFSSGGPGSDTSADYSRHIIQRLGKPEILLIANKKAIAEHIFSNHVEAIVDTATASPVSEIAKWAGTISGLLPHSPKQRNEVSDTVAKTTLDFTNLALDRLNYDKTIPSEPLLSMLRASRRLIKSGVYKRRSVELGRRLSKLITRNRILATLEQKLKEGGTDLEYRANQLIFATAQFKDIAHSLQDSEDQHQLEMLSWFRIFEKQLNANGLRLDAGSWLQRAQYVKRPSDLYSLYIQNAEACATFDHRRQRTWRRKIEHASKFANSD